nr:immunoglobulin heavy chain junction region [Mus musculus]
CARHYGSSLPDYW